MNDTRNKRTNNKKIYYDKIVDVKQNIDPQIIKPDVQKEQITFSKIKKEVHQKEIVKNEETMIPGGRLLATLKKERKDLIIKTKDTKDNKNKDRADKLLKLKELLRELKEE